jgi:beta-glucosidase
MPFARNHGYGAVKKAILAGDLTEEDVNRSAARLIRSFIRAFAVRKKYDSSLKKSQAHYDLAEKAALEGMTLVKNNGLLPLPAETRIAVVGPYADTILLGDHGSSTVRADDAITPAAGMKEIFRDVSVCNSLAVQKVLQASSNCDAVLVCIGRNGDDEGEALVKVSENNVRRKPKNIIGGDRTSLGIRPDELELFKELKGNGKKVIAALHTGSIILTREIEAYTDAIFFVYYGGVRGGRAIARLLSGQENFSGKLSISIARDEKDYPEFREPGQLPYRCTYGYYHGYTLFDKKQIEPQYPFGYGMSYTNFTLSDFHLSQDKDAIFVSGKIKNAGNRKGAEVVQVYIGSDNKKEDRPLRTLKGFLRVELDPGQEIAISIPIDPKDLMFYDPATESWMYDARYHAWVGNSSRHVVELPEIVRF